MTHPNTEQPADTSLDDLREKLMRRMSMDDNTKPEFFALWSLRDLQVECARLNQVLKECIEIMEKASKDNE